MTSRTPMLRVRRVHVVVLLLLLGVSWCASPMNRARAGTRQRARCDRPAAAGITTRHLTVDGVDREYRLSIPTSYGGSTRAPLLFDFHGLGSNMDQQAVYSGLEEGGGARGYVVITPQ